LTPMIATPTLIRRRDVAASGLPRDPHEFDLAKARNVLRSGVAIREPSCGETKLLDSLVGRRLFHLFEFLLQQHLLLFLGQLWKQQHKL
jgi:hypothetical protein